MKGIHIDLLYFCKSCKVSYTEQDIKEFIDFIIIRRFTSGKEALCCPICDRMLKEIS